MIILLSTTSLSSHQEDSEVLFQHFTLLVDKKPLPLDVFNKIVFSAEGPWSLGDGCLPGPGAARAAAL